LLPAVAGPFVGDVTHVVGIDTLRSTPLVVDEPPPPKASLDRILGLRPGFIDVSPAELLPWRSHLVPLVSRQLVGEQLVHLDVRHQIRQCGEAAFPQNLCRTNEASCGQEDIGARSIDGHSRGTDAFDRD
jgi:hypothetical protein